MNLPADAAIARAFREMSRRTSIGQPWTLDYFVLMVNKYAERLDAEAGGTDRQTEEVMQVADPETGSDRSELPVARGEEGKTSPHLPLYTAMIAGPYCRYCGRETMHMGDICFPCGKERKHDMSKSFPEITTSPERVQIPAESEHVAPYDRCPACTAHMPVGKTCGGKDCGLRRAE